MPFMPWESSDGMELNWPQPNQAHSPAPYSSSPKMSHIEMIPSTVETGAAHLSYTAQASQENQQMFTQQELPDINDQNIDEFITEQLAPPSDMTTQFLAPLSQNFSGSGDSRIFFDGYRNTETICMYGGKDKDIIKEEKCEEDKDSVKIKKKNTSEDENNKTHYNYTPSPSPGYTNNANSPMPVVVTPPNDISQRCDPNHGVTVNTCNNGQQGEISSRGQHTVDFHVHQGEAVSLQLGDQV